MTNKCDECPVYKECHSNNKGRVKIVLDLINRQKAKEKELQEKLVIYKGMIDHQKAEIERLQKAGEEAVSCFTRMESLYKIKCKELEVAKTEAIKEFAEKFKEKAGSIVTSCQGYEIYKTKQYQISAINFDNLVKEMTEQS